MHNLAITLKQQGHTVTGSDDEIYNPAHDRLAQHGLLPEVMGWNTARITPDIEAIVLGMHARKDNPELLRAQEFGLPIYSYPEYIYLQSKEKKRIVVAGSHGKTTTTSMIMHVLRHNDVDFDYLVGAQLEGFEHMVRLSDAPLLIAEGDEYPASPIDLRPKILLYKPHIAILTGIAWDHINVFPTFENYVEQFRLFINTIEPGGHLIYYHLDEHVYQLITQTERDITFMPYVAFDSTIIDGKTTIKTPAGQLIPLNVFGQHNLANIRAAYQACHLIGLTDEQFFTAISSFSGASKRLQLLKKTDTFIAYLDFAHAPSKVQATIQAVKSQYAEKELIACLELHTFSSLNKHFLSQYAHTMDGADRAFVFFSEHTLEMKKLPPITKEEVAAAFAHPNITVFTDAEALQTALKQIEWSGKNLLLMSSGTFGGMKYKEFVEELV